MDTQNHIDLALLAEEFKEGVINLATGNSGGLTNERYRDLRKTLLSVPNPEFQEKILPSFIKNCRTNSEFWSFIKSKFGRYEERRTYLSDELNRVIEYLENLNITPILDFHIGEGELLGRGGFGEVYKVHHKFVNLDFAVKVLSPPFGLGNQEDIDRFFREARILFSLNHPNIIRVYDVGLITPQKPFIRMEYFEGQTLAQTMKNNSLFPPQKALRFISKVLEGLAYAHEKGIVHRDLKPENIMSAKGEQLRIIDFGLGVFIEQDIVSRITKTGDSVVGGHYAAPEFIKEPKLLDPRSDLFSVSAIWYFALTGFAPAGSDLEKRLIDTTNIPNDYAKALLQGLKKIEDRYQSAQEMLEAIKNLQTG